MGEGGRMGGREEGGSACPGDHVTNIGRTDRTVEGRASGMAEPLGQPFGNYFVGAIGVMKWFGCFKSMLCLLSIRTVVKNWVQP